MYLPADPCWVTDGSAKHSYHQEDLQLQAKQMFTHYLYWKRRFLKKKNDLIMTSSSAVRKVREEVVNRRSVLQKAETSGFYYLKQHLDYRQTSNVSTRASVGHGGCSLATCQVILDRSFWSRGRRRRGESGRRESLLLIRKLNNKIESRKHRIVG